MNPKYPGQSLTHAAVFGGSEIAPNKSAEELRRELEEVKTAEGAATVAANDWVSRYNQEREKSARLLEVFKNYSCPYCLGKNYPRCLEYQSCSAIADYEKESGK